MGSCCWKDPGEPEPELRLLDSENPLGPTEVFGGPTKTRKPTDTGFLWALGIFSIGLLALVGYCMVYGDVYRIINSYDNCGNVCGRKNPPQPNFHLNCFGQDMTNKPHVRLGMGQRDCVTDCDAGDMAIMNRCFPYGNSLSSAVTDTYLGIVNDALLCGNEIYHLFQIAIGLSVLLLLVFRFLAGFVVWFIISAIVFISICVTLFFWANWLQHHSALYDGYKLEDNKGEEVEEQTFFYISIFFTIVTAILSLVIWAMRKRIQLVVQLFHESGKAVIAMPLIVITPILTCCCLIVVVAVYSELELVIKSSGHLKYEAFSHEILYYEQDTVMKAAGFFNYVALVWFCLFLLGCQHMVIAGAVAEWFFTRDKKNLRSPLRTSFSNLMRYHLGSVAKGSLLITVVKISRSFLRAIIRLLRNNCIRCLICPCFCCCCPKPTFSSIDRWTQLLTYLTRNATIEVAIYGEDLCTSGRQAFKVLMSNILRVATINTIGDFVLFLGKMFVVVPTVVIGINWLEDKKGLQFGLLVPLTLVTLFAYLIAHCFVSVFEMVIDSIFICFCEDCALHDGIGKPYFMSKELMEFIEKSKQLKLVAGDAAYNVPVRQQLEPCSIVEPTTSHQVPYNVAINNVGKDLEILEA